MVKIPERPYGYIARGLPDARLAGGGQAETLSTIGEGAAKLFGVALHLQEQRDHDLLVEAQNRYTKQVTDFTLQAEQNRTGDRARGFTREYSGQSDTTRNDVTKWLKDNGGSGMAERAFGNWATGRKTQGTEGAARFEHGQLKAHSKDLFDQRVQAIVDQVEHNPGSFGDAANQLQEAFTLGVGQGLFRPEEARARLHDAREKLSLTSFDNMYAMNRGQAMQSMEALGLTPAQQARAKKRYQADSRADAAIARAERAERVGVILEDYSDAEYVARRSGDVAGLESIGKRLYAAGDARRADNVMRQVTLYRENAAVIRESNEIPLGELVASIEKRSATYRDDAASAPESIATRSAGLHALEEQEKIYADRVAELKKDPAQAVTKRAAKAAEGLSGAALVDARLAAQTADGLPAPLRRALTGAEANALKNQWLGASGAERLQLFTGLQQTYGKAAGRVMGEIGLDPLTQTAARRALSLGTAEAAQAFVSISEAASAEDKALPSVEKYDTLKRDVIAQSQTLRAMRDMAARVMPGNASFAGKLRAAEDAAGRLLRMNGGNIETTISQLDAGLGRLEGKHALIFEKAAVDGDTLEKGLEGALKNLKDFGEVLPGYAEGDANRLDYLQRRGVWVNAPDGDGFVLFDPRSQAPIINGKGEFFRVRAKDAAALAMGVKRSVGFWEEQ
jgi:hypothetical protein